MPDKITSRGITALFLYELAQLTGQSWISKVAPTPFPSNSADEEYAGLGMAPSMREWVGGRQAKGLTDKDFKVLNKHFEATLKIKEADLRRDKTAQIKLRIGELADKTNSHWASLLTTLINNGKTGDCFDGKKFFAKNHLHGKSGTQENIVEVDISALPIPTAAHGSVTDPSVEEIAGCILKGIQKILSFKDDQGDPLNETANSFLVMVPTSLMIPAQSAITIPYFANGGTNNVPVSKFKIEVETNPRLTFTDSFPIFRTDGRVKPLLMQEETKVQIKAIAEGSELAFNTGEHHYGVDCWRNVEYWAWYQSVLVEMK